jgi:hypothetical protein
MTLHTTENDSNPPLIIDAFISLGLVLASTKSREEQVACRLRVLRSFRTDLERFAFLMDLQVSNHALFDGILHKDADMARTYSEMKSLLQKHLEQIGLSMSYPTRLERDQ